MPHLPSLRVHDILTFARGKLEIDKYLPIFKDGNKVPERAWLCNLSKWSILQYLSSYSYSSRF